MTGASYLATLNEQQRNAVEHGVAGTGSNVAGPLLVIAGAGSGKTNTLAHRVAHLIVQGTDPARLLLLTFSRRAAAEMERRARRIVATATKAAGRSPLLSSGLARSTPSAPGFCGCTRPPSASIPASPSTNGKIRPT
jgi:DNA helicase II / ATP-dependent DNA helicase PcrA